MGRHKLSSQLVRDLVKYAESKGFEWNGTISGNGHIILRHPNGGRVTLGGTPSRGMNGVNQRKDIDREARRGRKTV